MIELDRNEWLLLEIALENNGEFVDYFQSKPFERGSAPKLLGLPDTVRTFVEGILKSNQYVGAGVYKLQQTDGAMGWVVLTQHGKARILAYPTLDKYFMGDILLGAQKYLKPLNLVSFFKQVGPFFTLGGLLLITTNAIYYDFSWMLPRSYWVLSAIGIAMILSSVCCLYIRRWRLKKILKERPLSSPPREIFGDNPTSIRELVDRA